MEMDAAREKAVHEAFQRFIAEIASACGVSADSERVHELAFFFAGGAYQGRTGKSCLKALAEKVELALNRQPETPAP